VPVIVELCPAARIPTAQIYIEAAPNWHPRNTPCNEKQDIFLNSTNPPVLLAKNIFMTILVLFQVNFHHKICRFSATKVHHKVFMTGNEFA
jgi:hypothetical protein